MGPVALMDMGHKYNPKRFRLALGAGCEHALAERRAGNDLQISFCRNKNRLLHDDSDATAENAQWYESYSRYSPSLI
jgi:hypothetical protein